MRLIADDLTGALDSAAQFTGLLGPVPVYLRAPAAAVGPGALDLACRDGAEAEAVAANLRGRSFLDDDLVFKKIDSLLRGHWAAEVSALLATGRFGSCVLAPAFPVQGRITLQGRHLVRSEGAWRPVASLLERLRSYGLRAHLDSPADSPALHPAPTVLVPDAQSSLDLDRIAAWRTSLPKPILWIGSAGLARALAGTPARSRRTVTKPVLALIGSDHPVMRAQVEAAGLLEGVAHVTVAGDLDRAAAGVMAALRSRTCLATFAFPIEHPRHLAAEAIAERLGHLVRRLPPPTTLVVAGGETLRAISEATGGDHLLVLGEQGPGVPCSRIVGGVWDGVTVFSKSGAFGTAGFFADLLGLPGAAPSFSTPPSASKRQV